MFVNFIADKRTDEGLPMPSTVVETAVNDGLVSGDMDDQGEYRS